MLIQLQIILIHFLCILIIPLVDGSLYPTVGLLCTTSDLPHSSHRSAPFPVTVVVGTCHIVSGRTHSFCTFKPHRHIVILQLMCSSLLVFLCNSYYSRIKEFTVCFPNVCPFFFFVLT